MNFNVADLLAVQVQLERDAAAARAQCGEGQGDASTASAVRRVREQCGEAVQATPGRLYVGTARGRVHRPV